MHKMAVAITLAISLAAPASSAFADAFGAIAYSPSTHAIGTARNGITRRNAETTALKRCREKAADCRLVNWFGNACGALAAGPKGWGGHWGVGPGEAKKRALWMCSQKSSGCQILAVECTR